MRIRHAMLFLAAGIALASAYDEKSMPDLIIPEQIDSKSLEVNVTHRFYRIPTAQFPDNFIAGANVKVGLRYAIWEGLEVRSEYVFIPKEFAFDAGYTLSFPQLYFRAQAYLQFYGAQSDVSSNWNYNALYEINLQSTAILWRLFPVVNFAFDGLSKKFGLGTGLDIMILDNLDLVGEYYPVLGARDIQFNGAPRVDYFLAGVKLTTHGHHFMINVGNSRDMVMRRLMRGAPDNTLSYGFTIQRLFAF
ncbi:MAG TPA: DUF5777 family beta-barrel protein [Chitinivibrionales bacterium]|nr:DUF5777 family beta-barrel protein [Chitinivibrionales bacterium]